MRGEEGHTRGAEEIEELEKLKKQVAELEQQQKLAESQTALADALKNQLSAQYNLESEKARLPFAELTGIKAGVSGVQLPVGKEGTISIASGAAGTALLRSKKQMIRLLDTIAEELRKLLPDGAVMVTELQLEQAYQAEFMEKTIKDQIDKLTTARKQLKPEQPKPISKMALVSGVEVAYSVGLILDTVNSLAKLFRVDRKIDVFAADEEALQLLGYLLEGKDRRFLANPVRFGKAVTDVAGDVMKDLNKLLSEVKIADNLLVAEEKAVPASDNVVEVKTQLETAKTYLAGLDPAKNSEAFWKQVKGLLISRNMAGRDRLMLEAKAQALQMTKSWFWGWCSDRIYTCGEVHVLFRILDKDGAVKNAGVLLKTSRMEKAYFEKMTSVSFPT